MTKRTDIKWIKPGELPEDAGIAWMVPVGKGETLSSENMHANMMPNEDEEESRPVKWRESWFRGELLELLSSKHSVHQIGVHFVWTPKFRHCVLEGAVEVELRRIIGETCGHYGWRIEAIEIMPDHVHLFLQIDPFTAPAVVAKTLKSITAIQLFTLFPDLKARRFWGSGLWSRGTYYGSVGQVNEDVIKKYIEEQKANG